MIIVKTFESFGLLQYFKNIWSKDEQIKSKIMSDDTLLKKYAKYFNNSFDWNILSDNDLKKIYNNWNEDIKITEQT